MPSKVQREFIRDNWQRIEALENIFVGYGPAITTNRISHFLTVNFKEKHMDLILRLLENIDYYDNARTRHLVDQLGTMIRDVTNQNLDDVLFIPIDDSTGSSSDWLIRKLRNQMGLSAREHSNKFPRVYDLGKLTVNTTQADIDSLQRQKNAINNLPDEEAISLENLSKIKNIDVQIQKLKESEPMLPKTIVFVDEFIGSGTTVLEFLNNSGSWYSDEHDYHIATLCGHERGITKIQEYNDQLNIISVMDPLPDSVKLLHEQNNLFSKEEKGILKKYVHQAEPQKLFHYGYKNTQSNIVFYERASNNILPILYSETNWYPLFKR